LTEDTVPKIPCGVGGVATGATNTLVAVTVPLTTAPVAPAICPTQTLANDAELDPGSTKVVDVVTSTVKVEVLCHPDKVKAPVVSATPQAPDVADPFTEVTVPNAPWS
jgi:hypothetical protein